MNEKLSDIIPVTRAFLPKKETFLHYLDKIYESGWLTNNGPLVRSFEKRLAEYLGVKHLVLVSNGTLALQVAYKVLDFKDKAITTPFSFIATPSSLKWQEIEPFFCDIDSRTFTVDCNLLEKKVVEDGIKNIVLTHVFGNPCDVERIRALQEKHDLKIVYDAAHSFGVKYKGQSILNWGDISILSLHATKLMHSAEGGALILSNEEQEKKARLLINFGIEGPDVISEVGINAKMTELQAAMGLSVLDSIEEIINSRKTIWESYFEAFKNSNLQLQLWHEGAINNFGYFPVLFDSEDKMMFAKSKLEKEGVFPRRYFYPSLNTIEGIGRLSKCPVSIDISGRILCLPIYQGLTNENTNMIIRILEGVC